MPTKRGIQIDTVLLCLHAIERIGYRMPNFSYLKIEPLREHNLDVLRVNEKHARFNQMDVVSHVRYQSNVYLFLLLYECFPDSFCLYACRIYSLISPMLQVPCNPFSHKLLSNWGTPRTT
jgi:hypothetical protein